MLRRAAGIQESPNINRLSGEVPELAARLKADTEGRPNIHDAFVKSHGGAQVAARRIGQLRGDTSYTAEPPVNNLGIKGLHGVACQADSVFYVKVVAVLRLKADSVAVGAFTADCPEKLVKAGDVDSAKLWDAFMQQSHGDAPVRKAVNEVGGAVNRIAGPDGDALRASPAVLLAHKGETGGKLLQLALDELLGIAVYIRNEAVIGLELAGHVAAALERGLPGFYDNSLNFLNHGFQVSGAG